MTILEQCKALVAEEKTEEALALLMQHSSDATILKARYHQAERQRNVGLLDSGSWDGVLKRVKYALLELAATVPEPQPPATDDLRQLLAELLPYLHDLRVGFLEPSTNAAGYDQKTINELYSRLKEALK